MQRIDVDYVIIGAGVAGLSCALKARESGDVALLAKDNLPSGNTPLAQGGIAVALGKRDTPELHVQDTLRAGAGSCDPAAVNILVNEGIDRVQELLQAGFPCDRGPGGEPLLSKEGAHSVARVISAGGDTSGRALAETLIAQVGKISNICIYEQTPVIDLLVDEGRCIGAVALDSNSGRPLFFKSRAVVLATGGVRASFCLYNQQHLL